MKQYDNRQREIDVGEQWLGEVCDDPAGPDVDRIKLRTRVEAGEQWLKQRLCDTTPADLGDRIKQRMSEAVRTQRLRHEASTRKDLLFARPRALRWAATCAALAAVWFIAWVGLGRSVLPEQDDLTFVDAFEQYVDDDLVNTLGALNDDVDKLELAFSQTASHVTQDTMYDDLYDAVDNLAGEQAQPDDGWS